MIRCQVCGLTNLDALHHCQRCGSPISKRIPNSLSHTWAFLIAATILYIPANLLPMLVITKFEDSAPDTIFSGVVALINSGMVPIGLLVFVASILIPLIKIIGLVILLLNAHGILHSNIIHLSRLYRFIELVGRWSMLDVFMVSVLMGLVRFRVLEIRAGHGATAFACVVVLTLLASHTFDPRLMWDRHLEKRQL